MILLQFKYPLPQFGSAPCLWFGPAARSSCRDCDRPAVTGDGGYADHELAINIVPPLIDDFAGIFRASRRTDNVIAPSRFFRRSRHTSKGVTSPVFGGYQLDGKPGPDIPSPGRSSRSVNSIKRSERALGRVHSKCAMHSRVPPTGEETTRRVPRSTTPHGRVIKRSEKIVATAVRGKEEQAWFAAFYQRGVVSGPRTFTEADMKTFSAGSRSPPTGNVRRTPRRSTPQKKSRARTWNGRRRCSAYVFAHAFSRQAAPGRRPRRSRHHRSPYQERSRPWCRALRPHGRESAQYRRTIISRLPTAGSPRKASLSVRR